MESSVKLRNFQWASVKSVCEGLNSGHGVFALADEVGLGKTLVCAEVAFQLIARKASKRKNIIYYVAPSFELLDQNLKAIGRYLKDRGGKNFHVQTSVSRLSRVPLELVPEATEAAGKKGTIHIIGLSPGTSFRIAGQGQLQERAYLAALFGFRRLDDTKDQLASYFWRLKRERHHDDPFMADIANFSDGRNSGELRHFRRQRPLGNYWNRFCRIKSQQSAK
ncbi:MAG: DEAD/DEAH box helicase family protein [Bdellovibrionota bacterium]